MEDQKHGEDQLEYCSGSATGITQHIGGVSVKKSRKVSKIPKWILDLGSKRSFNASWELRSHFGMINDLWICPFI